ncbi:MAG: adenosine kinase, partial [Asticcacaulis sp.]
PALIADSRILYLEGYLFDSLSGRAAFERACAIAGEAGRTRAMTLSDTFVVDRWRSDLLDFITHAIDLVFANEAELLALFETSDFNRALNSLREIAPLAAVTRSDQGSVIVQGDEIHLVPVYPVDQVVDTTGAGDQYAAGFMYGLSHDLPLETCGRLGSLAAAEVISHYGPRPMVSLRDLARTHKLIKDI